MPVFSNFPAVVWLFSVFPTESVSRAFVFSPIWPAFFEVPVPAMVSVVRFLMRPLAVFSRTPPSAVSRVLVVPEPEKSITDVAVSEAAPLTSVPFTTAASSPVMEPPDLFVNVPKLTLSCAGCVSVPAKATLLSFVAVPVVVSVLTPERPASVPVPLFSRSVTETTPFLR